ncbi:MAG: hypothetical protein JSU00_22030 [Acidobacteria bacterium]|nr:hypothetical protein [Acidobacteriota bacterium]
MRTVLFCLAAAALVAGADKKVAKSAASAPAVQKMDEVYGAKIREYTTEPFFLTELVDHLPASDTVPSPDKVIGYVVGTPDKLTYTKDIYRYLRELEKASKRVKIFSIGKSEEGRDTLIVAISDEANIARLDHYREITAKLADPRVTPKAEAAKLIDEGLPFYWATGAIHSPETGSPEMLMELAYRLAVEDSPVIQNIRKNSIVLITPVSEVDGRDRQVDVYRYRKANPTKPAPNLVYWGKYVAHDNNRDSMGMGLALTRNMMNGFLQFHATVLHDLHESVPFLYTSTGMGPYNAWLDPIVVGEWQKMAYLEIEEMTKRGVPGVWTHGYYDGWAPNYMFYVANGHNSIGRFYETYGGSGADTRERTVPAGQTTRTWFRPNPPLPKVKWSIRNNINLQQSAILFSMNNVASKKAEFLSNFYLKSQRSVEKAAKEGPTAWVIPGDDPRPGEVAELVNLLRAQAVEVHRLDQETEIAKVKYPAGSYVVRMDQPYSRMADMLLDTQYYNISDPSPYDDTGWTVGALRNVKTVRLTDPAALKAQMTLLRSDAKAPGGVRGAASAAYIVNHNADNTLATFRFRLANVKMLAAEDSFQADGRTFNAGSFIIKADRNGADLRARIEAAASELGVTVFAAGDAPTVASHELAAPRIALVHSWLNTQTEGWYRIAFDRLKIPYEYISDQKLREITDLRARYDVIIFGPTPGASQRIVNGIPKRGDPIPWKGSDLTPNLAASPDTTDDMRGGMGLDGLLHVAQFVDAGGLFVTIAANDSIPIDYGLIDGVAITPTRDLRVRGSVLNAAISDKHSPIAYGYGDRLAIYFNQAPVLQVSATGVTGGMGGGGGAGFGAAQEGRPTGRGSVSDPDIPQGRQYAAPAPRPQTRPGEEPPISDEMREQMRAYLPPPELRPRVVVRFAADEKELLVSGMLSGGRELTGRPAVVDAPRGKGHVLLFANNPMWRNETQGSYFLLFNAMLNFDHLGVGRTAPASRGAAQPSSGDDMDQ